MDSSFTCQNYNWNKSFLAVCCQPCCLHHSLHIATKCNCKAEIKSIDNEQRDNGCILISETLLNASVPCGKAIELIWIYESAVWSHSRWTRETSCSSQVVTCFITTNSSKSYPVTRSGSRLFSPLRTLLAGTHFVKAKVEAVKFSQHSLIFLCLCFTTWRKVGFFYGIYIHFSFCTR